jgi:hypothetical protein
MRKPILQVAREGIMPTGFPTVVNQHFFNPAPGRVPQGTSSQEGKTKTSPQNEDGHYPLVHYLT